MPAVSIKSVILGAAVNLVASVVLGLALFAAATMSFNGGSEDVGSGPVWMALYLAALGLPPVIAGYTGAAIAGKSELINGTLVGVLCAIVGLLFMILLEGFEGADIWYAAALVPLPLLSFIGACLYLVIGWPRSARAARLLANGRVKIAAQIMLALAGGFILMTLLDIGLFAPSGAWLSLAVVCFALMGCTPWFHRFRDAPLFVVGAVFGLGLQGLAPFLEMDTPMAPSLYRLLGACAGTALLGYFAQRRFLLAFVIAFPALIDASCLFCMPALDATILEHFGFTLAPMLPLPMAAFAGAALAHLAQRIQRR
jgi:hypothetical protein